MIYKNIYDSFFSYLYLNILSIVKDRKVSLMIIDKSIQWLISYENVCNYDNLNKKFYKYLYSLVNEYVLKNKDKLSNVIFDLNQTIPNEVYLFSFNLDKVFNYIDNLIFTSYMFNRKSIKEIKVLINFDESYIKDRINKIMLYCKSYYENNIKLIINAK